MSAAGSWENVGIYNGERFPEQPNFSGNQHEQLAEANRRAKKVLRAARMAAFNVYVFGFFASASLLFAAGGQAFGSLSISSLVIGIGMAAIAWNEHRGCQEVRKLQISGLKRLGWNQIAFAGLIALYCLWAVYAGTNVGAEMKNMDAFAASQVDVDAVFQERFGSTFDEFCAKIIFWFYAGVALLTAIFQGANALYYFTRIRLMRKYLKDTPEWIVDVQRTGLVC